VYNMENQELSKKFYLTEKGNILNVAKQCFQTINGAFLRLVSDDELEYLENVLMPVEFPKGIIEPKDTPIWHFICQINKDGFTYDYFGRNNHGKFEFCYREVDVYNDDYDNNYDYNDDDDNYNHNNNFVEIFDVDLKNYGYYSYKDIEQESLYFTSKPCKLDDMLDTKKYLTFNEILNRNKKLAEIGLYINSNYDNVEKITSKYFPASGAWYIIERCYTKTDFCEFVTSARIYIPCNNQITELEANYRGYFDGFTPDGKYKIYSTFCYGHSWQEVFEFAIKTCEQGVEKIEQAFLNK